MGTVTEPVLTYVLIGINVAVALGTFLERGQRHRRRRAQLLPAR